MLSWQELSQQLQRFVNDVVRLAKARKREEAAIGLAALLFWLGHSFPTFFPPDAELSKFVNSWHGVLIAQCILYVAGAGLLLYSGYRTLKLVWTPDLPPPKDRPSAIKGPIAFTPADGELFRRLKREDELTKLLGFIEDDQVRLVVLMGASGVGKTSLLRAGLTDILKNKGIDYHYWEAVPTAPGQRLLRAIQESWQTGAPGDGASNPATVGRPEALEDLINPAPALGTRRHVVVLDQFEQLHGSGAKNPVLSLLRKVAREAKPPHRVTWIVTFRREFRAEWEDFTLPEKERGIYPAEISLRLFTAEQASDVIGQLIAEAKLSIHQKVVDNLVAAATVDGEVSPVDIGIGLLVLSELHERQGGQTVTLDDYQFAGGAEGLLTQYLSRCLDIFPETDRQTILNAMLALRDPDTSQRIAEGRTCAELAQAAKAADAGRLKTQLERLTQRDVRLLESVAPTDESETRYRLPHERLIPALHRLAGQVLAEVDQAKIRFENAFAAWKKSGQAQYLLKAGDLRTVERYETQIPWGKDAPEKRAFLRRSQHRRTLNRLGIFAAVLCLLATGWLAKSQYQHYEARTYLTDNHYPPELYDWQHQLKILALNDQIDVRRFPWPRSNTLEELTIHIPATANSLDGLVNLANCRALKTLTLDISGSKVSDLTPLTKLTALTQLNLDISGSNVSDLTPLTKLTALTQLNLAIRSSKVSDLTPLTKLTALTQLNLDLRLSKVSDLTPLTKLTALTQLNLNINYSEVSDLTPLTKLTALTQLNLNINYSEVSDLTPLTKLTALTQLNLDLSGSNVSDLTPLTKLTALTQLNLDISGSNVSDLTPLTKLTALTQLNLAIRSSKVSDLTPLTKLTALTQLNLNINYSEVSDLTPLTKLTALTQLNLAISGSNVSDLTPLTKLTALTQLNLAIRSSKVSDLTPLTKLTALTQLNLDLSGSNVSDLTPLTKLTALTQLNLAISGSNVSDLTPLTKLTALTQLNLAIRSSKVSDLTPLTKLTALTQLNLDLRLSKVSDLTPLTKLTALTQLNLNINYSEVSDLTPLTKLTALTQLNLAISDSKVSDLTPLTKLNSCQTLVLTVNTNQRMSLKVLPPKVAHLEF